MTGHILIERADPADAAIIRDIAIAARIDAWSEADYVSEISRPDSFVLKSLIDGTVTGFLLARTVPGTAEKRDVDLYNIAVHREFSRRGIGSALLGHLIEMSGNSQAENIWLEVRQSNTAAIRFYEQVGFVSELTRPRFYRQPVEDAVIMRLKLTSSP